MVRKGVTKYPPLYQQIKEELRGKIQEKNFTEDRPLPSQHQLQVTYQVSQITVRRALQELTHEGLVYSLQGKGVFVSKESSLLQKQVLRIGSYSNNPAVSTQRKLFEIFEKRYPQIRIEPFPISSNYLDHLHYSFEKGTALDLFMLSEMQFPILNPKDYLLELTPFLKKEIREKDYYQKPFGLFRLKGKQYAIPFMFSPVALFYNQTLFDQLGIPYPDESYSWKGFLDIAKKLTRDTNSDGKVDQYGFLFPLSSNRWPIFLLQNEGGILNSKGTKALINSSNSIAAVEFCYDLFYKNKVSPTNSHELRNIFAQGKAGMIMDSYYFLYKYQRAKKFSWAIAPLPRGKIKATALLATSFAIWKGSKRKELAFEFIRFMLSQEAQNLLKEEGEAIPILKRVAENSSNSPPGYHTFREVFRCAQPILQHPKYLEIFEIIRKEMDLVWTNLQSPKKACKKAGREIDRLLKGGKNAVKS